MFNDEIIKKQKKSARPLKIAKEIKVILSDVILKGKFQDSQLLDLFITINQVVVSSDLSSAKITVSCLDPKKDIKEVLKILNKNKAFFRHKVGQALHIKVIPVLHFYEDLDVDKLEKIQRILDKIKQS